MKAVYAAGVREKTAIPGAAIAIQTFGDFLGYNPHLHILVSDGCFHESGMFSVSASVDTKALEMLFRHNVLKMLLKKGKISRDLIALMEKWRHTGFNVFVGQRIFPGDETAMENLARYIIRASFSQERMTYLQQTARVENKSVRRAGMVGRHVFPRTEQASEYPGIWDLTSLNMAG